MVLQRTTSDHADFLELVQLLDKDLAIRDGDEHAFYAQFNKTDAIRNVVVLYIDNTAVGCGAFKKYNDSTVEIKRMFVHPDSRGKGNGALMLEELEQWAAELNYAYCILETGKKQLEAISLYKKCGYHITPNFGQYKNVENSVCMMKNISDL